MRSNIICLLGIKGFSFWKLPIHNLAHFTYRFPVFFWMIYKDALYIVISPLTVLIIVNVFPQSVTHILFMKFFIEHELFTQFKTFSIELLFFFLQMSF